MKRTKSWNPRARQSSAMARAVAEAMESRRYLAAPELLDYDQYATYEGEDISLYLEIIDPDNMGITFLTIDWDNGEIPSEWVPDVDFSTEDWIIHSSYFDNPAAPETAHHATITATDADNETGTFYVDLIADNANPVATIGNSGAINEGGTVTVSLSDAIDLGTADMSAGLRYSFATSYGALAGSYSAAGSTPSAAFTPTDDGTKTYYARVLDKDDGYTDYSTTVAVANVAPFATLTFSDPDSSGNVTVSLANAHDPSSDDTSAGFKYAFNLVYNSLPSTYAAAGSTSSQVFLEAQLADGAIVYARIFDPTGYRNYQIGTTDMSAQVVSSSQINLTWTDDVTDELGWRVQWSDDGSFGTGHVWYVNLAADVDHYEVIDVPDGTRRWFRVRAFSDAIHPGESIYSPKMAATTILPPPTNLVASNLNHSPTDMDINVSWDIESEHHTGFTITWTGTVSGNDTVGSGTNNYTIEDLEPGDVVSFTVRALGTYSNSTTTAAENRTLHPGSWLAVYDGTDTLMAGLNDDFYVQGGTWTPYTIGDEWFGNEAAEFTLFNLPQHTYAAVDITLSVYIDDPYWDDEEYLEAYADSAPLRIYEEGGYWRVEIDSGGAGSPIAFKHGSSEMAITVDMSALPSGATWQVLSTQVLVYFPYVNFTYDVSSSATEGGQDGKVTVGRFGAVGTVLEDPLVVNLLDLGGTAASGADYNLPTTITIPAGQTSAYVMYGVVNNTTPEWTEKTTIRLKKNQSTYARADEAISTEQYYDRPFEIVDDDLYLELPEYEDDYVIPLNNDDDDNDGIIDYEDDEIFSDDGNYENDFDDDLFPMTLDVPDEVKAGATVTLIGPWDLIRVWENRDKSGTQLIGERDDDEDGINGSHTWIIGQDTVPGTVWVENWGSQGADIELTLTASDALAVQQPAVPTSNVATPVQPANAKQTVSAKLISQRDLHSPFAYFQAAGLQQMFNAHIAAIEARPASTIRFEQNGELGNANAEVKSEGGQIVMVVKPNPDAMTVVHETVHIRERLPQEWYGGDRLHGEGTAYAIQYMLETAYGKLALLERNITSGNAAAIKNHWSAAWGAAGFRNFYGIVVSDPNGGNTTRTLGLVDGWDVNSRMGVYFGAANLASMYNQMIAAKGIIDPNTNQVLVLPVPAAHDPLDPFD